jgi:hypothetical protein
MPASIRDLPLSKIVFKEGKRLFYSCFLKCCVIACALASPNAAHSFEVLASRPAESSFKDRLSLQLVSGSLSAIRFSKAHVHTLDYWQTNLRLGWALNQPEQKNSLGRGNFEAILELTGSYVYRGPGTYIAGVTALLRYNFVQPEARFIPYVQAGAGVVYNDVYREESQDAIGQAIEFTPQGSIGIRCLFSPNWSVDIEAMYHHISNANLARRNDGINALGGFIGVTYFFSSR